MRLNSRYTYITISLVVILLCFWSSIYLPDRFLYDAYTIVLDEYNEIGWLGSYPFAILFYSYTHLANIPFYLSGLLQLLIIFYGLYQLGVPRSFKDLTLRNAIVWIGLLLVGLFLSYPSKEFINILYLLIMCRIIMKPIALWKKILISSVMLLFFSWFFRPYYAIVPIVAIFLYVINLISIHNKVISRIITGIAIMCFISLSYGVINGEFMSEGSRQDLNKRRLSKQDQDADTMILSPVEPDTFYGETISIFYGFFTVNLPFNSLRFWYKPQVIAFFLWQMGLFYLLIVGYGRVMNDRKYNHEKWIMHLVISYFILQGVFEPDLGSAMRHKIGIFPLLWLAIYYNKNLIKRPVKEIRYVVKSA